MHNAEEFKAHLETKSNLATRTPLPKWKNCDKTKNDSAILRQKEATFIAQCLYNFPSKAKLM